MSKSNPKFLSTLAVLAAASLPADAQAQDSAQLAQRFLQTASRTAVALTPCMPSALDLVGDAALRMWARHREVLEKGNFRGYLEACLRNLRRDHLRRWHRTPLFTDLRDDDEEFDPTGQSIDDQADGLATIREFRDALGHDDREVLGQLETGKSVREIAEVLGVTRHQVRGSIKRIRQRASRYFDCAES